MSEEYTTRLDEWADWFVYNHDRLRLYYQGSDVREMRYRLMRTTLDGNFELCALILEQIQEMWDILYEAPMARELVEHIQREVAWFYRHKDTIRDPDKQHAFVVQSQGKVLKLLQGIGQELDRLSRGAEHEQPETVAVISDDEEL